MFKTVIATILVLVIAVTAFFIWDTIGLNKIVRTCEKPVGYTVGSFDRRFNISHTDFLAALSSAEALWEEAIDRELFVYDPEKGNLSVNLVYDSRQEVTDALSDLGHVLEENEATYELLQTRYAGLKTEYESLKDTYTNQVEALNKKNALYQKQVENWNKGPRTSKDQFAKLETNRMLLERDLVNLRALENQLNNKVKEVNTLAGQLNNLAKTLNLGVETYNTIGSSRGESFTGGLFYSWDGKEGINIYEFDNQDKLVRVLAHELGHALGLDHNSDPDAVMYYLNEDTTGTLSETDLEALEILCGLD